MATSDIMVPANDAWSSSFRSDKLAQQYRPPPSDTAGAQKKLAHYQVRAERSMTVPPSDGSIKPPEESLMS